METFKGLIMTSWDFGGNCLPQYRSGSIYLIDQPLWLALIGWFSDEILSRICDLLMYIPLPNYGRIIDEGEFYTIKEYYGTVGDLFHVFVHDPVFQWHWNHKKKKEIIVEVGYDRLKELFSNYDNKYFEEMEHRELDGN